MRDIDRVPMREGLVVPPAAWAWGSHRACTEGSHDLLACPHASYLALARGRGERRRCYARLATSPDDPRDIARAIPTHLPRTGVRGASQVSSPHPGHASSPA